MSQQCGKTDFTLFQFPNGKSLLQRLGGTSCHYVPLLSLIHSVSTDHHATLYTQTPIRPFHLLNNTSHFLSECDADKCHLTRQDVERLPVHMNRPQNITTQHTRPRR